MNYCQHGNGSVTVRLKIANGHIQVRNYCMDCQEVFGAALSQKSYSAAQLAMFPLIETTYTNPPCAVCGNEYTTLHHFMPQAIARKRGINPDAWPTAYLCRDCHALWHEAVTPGLLKPGWKG